MRVLPKIAVIAFTAMCVMLTGCSATYTAIKKRNLDVQTKMSDTVFLDPVKPSERVVFLQIRNTSDQQDIKIKSQIVAAIEAKGYRVTDDPDKAHYMIQANILQVSKSDKSGSQAALLSGYGSGIVGAAVGASIAGGGTGRVGTGLIGGLIGMAADAMVEDVYFTMVTDVQISERAGQGVKVTEEDNARLHQGTSGSKKISSTQITHWKRYQTRIISVANKVNLDFNEALPKLQQGLIHSIAGIL
ncbi:complement resistance protein TraT [Celerinatantimonas diazotrophica]|uniref:TraT complement resistance protein n=1 Tax=Celerinatantimonas diazotrophica TaxID=412034 RepID=A0A4R1J903_9GAMM|nr:complement resistance protein TraT [Celerinatantimonas diazotrophica]TCK47056.1 TraT complement resistance protein [Celerinatantimonas diazotrophica]CAG9295824.1 Lipoprotein YlpA [Celerinatantimonas diazotrophica]